MLTLPFLFLGALFFLLSGQEEEVEVDPPRGIFLKKKNLFFCLRGSNKECYPLPVSPFSLKFNSLYKFDSVVIFLTHFY